MTTSVGWRFSELGISIGFSDLFYDGMGYFRSATARLKEYLPMADLNQPSLSWSEL